MSRSKHESGLHMIEIAPRALSEDGSGYFCYRCRKDLGIKVEGGPVNKFGFKKACHHFGVHRREMRKQL